ncbi:MAG: glycosyltransferase family 39 protein [Planctomycetota bacterium]
MKEIPPDDGAGTNAVPVPEELSTNAAQAGALYGRTYAIAAALIVVLAAFLRFFFIARYEIWLDEAYCHGVAIGSFREIIRDLRLDNGPPLYYLMLHGWMRLFGETPAAVRALSAVFSAATVALVAFWNARWLSRKARLLSAFILAVTPLALYYAQEARMYSPVVFFATVAVVFLERAIREGRPKDYVYLSLFTALSLYTSYIAIFLVPLGYVTLAVAYSKAERKVMMRRLGGLVAAHAVAAIAFLPWLPIFLRQPRAEATQWIARLPGARATAQLPLRSLSVMTVGGGYYPTYLRHLRMDPALVHSHREHVAQNPEAPPRLWLLTRIPPVAALAVMVALTVHMFWKALARGTPVFPVRTFLATYIILPIAAPLVLSLARPMYVVGRYEVIALPAFAVLSGLGLEALGRRLRVVWLVLAAVLFAYTWAYAQSWPETGGERERVDYLHEIAAPGDVVIAEAFEHAPVFYYARLAGCDLNLMSFPRETKAHSAWIDYDRWLETSAGIRVPSPELYTEARETVAEAIREAGSLSAVIIVRTPSSLPWADAMELALVQAFREVEKRELAADERLSNSALRIVVYRKTR